MTLSPSSHLTQGAMDGGGIASWPGDIPTRPLKVAVIREEFVALTGDPLIAVVLNQLLYWTQRVKDFDLLLEEEKFFKPECNVSPRHGWIYKTAYDLIQETMLQVSHPTMRKYLKLLIDRGWIDERVNPHDKWDKTTQYRLNLRQLQEDLANLGYSLPGFYGSSSSLNRSAASSNEEDVVDGNLQGVSLMNTPASEKNPNVRNLQSNENPNDPILPNTPETAENPNVRNLHSNVKNFDSNEKNLQSNVKNLHSYTYTETTSKTKNREHTQDACVREDFSIFEEMLNLWRQHIGQDVHLIEIRKRQLESILTVHFQNDIAKWEELCIRIKASPFLMGEGAREWRISLDWVLVEKNLLKILEGNFDRSKDKDPAGGETTRSEAELSALKESQNQQKAALIDTIQDPLWKEWCYDLLKKPAYGSYAPPSIFCLQDLVKARFTEFDGRLVYIECEDKDAVNRAEEFRFQLISIVQQTFPKALNLRIQLKPVVQDDQSSTESLIHPHILPPSTPNLTQTGEFQ